MDSLSIVVSGLPFGVLMLLCVRRFVQLRERSNRVLKLADAEFYDAVNSLMKTPEEVPDDVMKMLSGISEMSFKPGADRELLKIVQSRNKAPRPASSIPPINWEGMRPELQALVDRALRAWFTIVSNQSVVTGWRIREADYRKRIEAGSLAPKGVKDTMELVGQLVATGTQRAGFSA